MNVSKRELGILGIGAFIGTGVTLFVQWLRTPKAAKPAEAVKPTEAAKPVECPKSEEQKTA